MVSDRETAETPYPPMTEDGEQCVRCGVTFGKEESDRPVSSELNLCYGPVVRLSDGSEWDAVIDTPAGTECVHPWCWERLEAERRHEENHSLGQWVQSDD